MPRAALKGTNSLLPKKVGAAAVCPAGKLDNRTAPYTVPMKAVPTAGGGIQQSITERDQRSIELGDHTHTSSCGEPHEKQNGLRGGFMPGRAPV